ncbi:MULTISPECIES: hypothetical protein [Marinobacter]|uniref:hypothetical protein n=1 Tax=Marinobacter TaxID=2742 RepID=UPI000DAE6B3C|nr:MULTISPECIES: hypothetical protein [Marinobacter]
MTDPSLRHHDIPLWWLALVAALLPFVTMHTTWPVATLEGYIHGCLPYGLDCHSISRTGHKGLAYFLFKGGMLPAAVVGMTYWWLNGVWLRSLGASAKGLRGLFWLGLIGGLALVAYTLALGHTGDGYWLVRRIGVITYLSFTFIAQLLVTARLLTLPDWAATGRRLLRLCQLTLALGIASLIMDAVAPETHERFEDAFEWWLALLLNLHALWIALLWRRSGFHVGPGVHSPSSR